MNQLLENDVRQIRSNRGEAGFRIPLYRPSISEREREYVMDCLDSTWISSKGKYVPMFESGFAKAIDAAHATSVCNGTVALQVSLQALGIGPGDEVIVPTLTYVASANAIVHAGATPVFADSLMTTWQIDPADVARRIGSRTRAIMVVHLYGLPCDMNAITALCREHGLYLIEDCAEAIGTRYGGRHIGSFGDVAAFSFFANKTITTGEGGMVVSNDASIIEAAYRLKTQGVSPDREYWHETLGYNYRMTNICAALGVAQLESIDRTLARKREIAAQYRERLRGYPLYFHDEPPGLRHSFWLCCIAVDDSSIRDPLRSHLRGQGIETRPVFHPAHTLPYFSRGESHPNAQSIASRGICLPSYPGLEATDIDFVCDEIGRALELCG